MQWILFKNRGVQLHPLHPYSGGPVSKMSYGLEKIRFGWVGRSKMAQKIGYHKWMAPYRKFDFFLYFFLSHFDIVLIFFGGSDLISNNVNPMSLPRKDQLIPFSAFDSRAIPPSPLGCASGDRGWFCPLLQASCGIM